jgi:nucleoporin NDC1
VLITTRFDDRRKSIYQELERDNNKSSTWSQILTVCLAEVQGITARIDAVQSPQSEPGAVAKLPVVDLVPRISQPLKEDKIMGNTMPVGAMGNFEKIAGDLVKSRPLPPGSSPEIAGHRFVKAIANSRVSPSSHASIANGASDFFTKFIHSPFGVPFRQSFRRTVNVVIAGTPYSHAGTIADAATALAGLVACSLKEDQYGRVQKDVPDIIRAFVAAIKKIDDFVTRLDVHWTDVDFVGKSDAEKNVVPEVKQVVDALSDGLRKILLAWVEFLDTCGLTKAEVREAKALAERGAAR